MGDIFIEEHSLKTAEWQWCHLLCGQNVPVTSTKRGQPKGSSWLGMCQGTREKLGHLQPATYTLINRFQHQRHHLPPALSARAVPGTDTPSSMSLPPFAVCISGSLSPELLSEPVWAHLQTWQCRYTRKDSFLTCLLIKSPFCLQ